MSKILLVVHNNYVVNRIVVNDEDFDNYVYPLSHDFTIEDTNSNIYIGDWYEASEGLFYRPIGTPNDWPQEILPTTNNE
jgi:hypothetical protein